MDLPFALIGIQVTGVLGYFAVAGALYKIYIKTLKATIKQKQAEIDGLKDQLKTPQELEASLNICKERYLLEVKVLKEAVEKTKNDGDEKAKIIIQASLETMQIALNKVEELKQRITEMEPYREKWEKHEQMQKYISEALATMRVDDGTNYVNPIITGLLYGTTSHDKVDKKDSLKEALLGKK